MKQLISVLVAAIFAAASVTAVAQDKKGEKADKSSAQVDKKDGKKAKASKRASKKAGSKKADGAKKDEMKK